MKGKATRPGAKCASRRAVPRSRRPCACADTRCAGTGRPRNHPHRRPSDGSVGEGLWPQVRHARFRGVAHRHSTEEGAERNRPVPAKEALEGRPVAKGSLIQTTAIRTQRRRLRAFADWNKHVRCKWTVTADPRQEPYEVVPHVRICAGGARKRAPLPRPPQKTTRMQPCHVLEKRTWGKGLCYLLPSAGAFSGATGQALAAR